MATEDLTRMLDEAGVRYELFSHAHTESAVAEAEALGLAPADVAKTLVVTTREGYVRAVLPASERIDLHKLREITGGGGGRRDPVVVDRRLAERDSFVLEAGSHELSLRVPTGDLLQVTGAEVADICVD
jgi:prolyl-tRNA editing enzyme YbaK/EbsC (Cys-tRNA(Pro) deacylase)